MTTSLRPLHLYVREQAAHQVTVIKLGDLAESCALALPEDPAEDTPDQARLRAEVTAARLHYKRVRLAPECPDSNDHGSRDGLTLCHCSGGPAAL